MLTQYPKQILSLHLFLTHDSSKGLHKFSASLNGLLCALNQAGIALKVAPCAALTLTMDKDGIFTDDYEEGKNSVVDVVVEKKGKIVYMKSWGQGCDLYGMLNDEGKFKEMQKRISKMSKAVRKAIVVQE